MKKQKTQNTNKGITLIALVITIIVMLILVAVTITMAVNGGLFEYASSAGTKTNGAKANEQEFANLEEDMTVNQLIDKYTGWTEDNSQGGTGTNTITFTIDGTSYTATQGMSWGTWVESDYNTSSPKLREYNWGLISDYVIPGSSLVSSSGKKGNEGMVDLVYKNNPIERGPFLCFS